MIYRLLPLLIKYDVDIYFCGHEHNFQLLKYDYNHMSENSYKRNDSYKRNNKLHFVVNGAGTFSSNVVHKNKNPIIST